MCSPLLLSAIQQNQFTPLLTFIYFHFLLALAYTLAYMGLLSESFKTEVKVKSPS